MLVGDSVICLDPTDDGLGAGFLEFRAQGEGPLEMGVQTYHKHRQKEVVVVPCFGAAEVASVYEVLDWALDIREGERISVNGLNFGAILFFSSEELG
jgi:hypothetical protein